MSNTARIGAAVAAGYFLGRFKKLRLALTVGSALANKEVRTKGLSLLHEGVRGLSSNPEVKKIGEQVTGQLADAGKAAAVTAAAGGIDKLSDRLNERSSQLRDTATSKVPGAGKGQGQEEQPEDQAQEQPQDQGEEEQPPEEPEDQADQADQDQGEEEEPEEPEDQADEADQGDEEQPEQPTGRSNGQASPKPSQRRGRSAAPARGRS